MTNTNQVAQFKTVQEKLVSKIKEQFADLVSDETWNNLIETQIEEFTEKELPRIVREECERKLREYVLDILTANMTSAEWTHKGQQMAGTLIQEFLRTNGTDILFAMFGPALQMMANNLRDSITNMGRY